MTWRDILLITLCVLVFLDWKCRKESGEAGTGDTLSTSTHASYDTTIYIHERKDIYHHSSDTVFLPEHVDTNQVIREYFTRYAYKDTIADTSMIAFITDTIWKNGIAYRNFSYKILRPTTITNTVIVAPQPPRFYLEGLTALNTDNVTQLTLKLDYFTKKSQLFSGGWDFKNKAVVVGAGLRIK